MFEIKNTFCQAQDVELDGSDFAQSYLGIWATNPGRASWGATTPPGALWPKPPFWGIFGAAEPTLGVSLGRMVTSQAKSFHTF